MTIIKQITDFLEEKAPLPLQENYDNCGLQTGNAEAEVKGILVCLDVTELVVDEAIQQGCNLIVSHHPVIFGGIKSLTGKTYVERTLLKAIKNDIAIYAIHTNLDNVIEGVNAAIAARLGLHVKGVIKPKPDSLLQLVTYVPVIHRQKVLNALFEAGAGGIGNYKKCSFILNGTGSFMATGNANPFTGNMNELHFENEDRIEVILPSYARNSVFSALRESHPYEEIAYEFIKVENLYNNIGAGIIGDMEQEIPGNDFLKMLKAKMELQVIRYTHYEKPVKTIAVCGGSGSFLLADAMRAGADVLVTADFKYHQFFDADNRIMIADIGHYESEKFTINLLGEWLSEKFPNFAVIFTKIETNPVNYYI